MKIARLRDRGGFGLEGQSIECAKVFTLPCLLVDWLYFGSPIGVEAWRLCVRPSGNSVALPAPL